MPEYAGPLHGDTKVDEENGSIWYWHAEHGWIREQEWKETYRAVVTLSEEDLRHILELPDDVHIKWIEWNNQRWQFEIGVYGKGFDQVPSNVEAPILSKYMAKNLCNRGFPHFKISFPKGMTSNVGH